MRSLSLRSRSVLAAVPVLVLALAIAVLGLLIATSRYYDVLHVLPLIVPLGVMLAALIVLGSYLILRALDNIHRYDRMIAQLKDCHSKLSQFLE